MLIPLDLGNLYFANVKMSDARDGKRYVCIASNHIIRGLVQGDDQVIRPFRHGDEGNSDILLVMQLPPQL